MFPNPGGLLDPDDILGRDDLITRIWTRLNAQSLSLPAERRLGKTHVLKKMAAEPINGWVAIYQDLEAISSANEFAKAVYERVENRLGRRKRLFYQARGFISNLSGGEIGGILTLPTLKEPHWKDFLGHVIDDLLNKQAPNRVVFFWDEFPWMLEKIRDNEGEQAATDLLDLLRSFRQTKQNFRAIYTGSIGLHHVLKDLKRKGYGNEPFNDMGPPIEVGPLAVEHAEVLARRLLESVSVKVTDRSGVVRTIVRETGGVAHYIHALIDAMSQVASGTVGEADVSLIVRRMLTEAGNAWNMKHYQDRIPQYYPGDERLVHELLDGLAVRDEPATIDEILQDLSQSGNPPARDHLRETLRLLVLDHYLNETHDRRYVFLFPLVRRWWSLERELPGAR